MNELVNCKTQEECDAALASGKIPVLVGDGYFVLRGTAYAVLRGSSHAELRESKVKARAASLPCYEVDRYGARI